MHRFFRVISILRVFSILAAVQIFIALTAFAFYLDAPLDPASPFVICKNQQYALCAEASCFVYDGVAYCKCNIKRGDSISLQLSYSSSTGERNVCDVNRQGRANGYMVSTFGLPKSVEKGGSAAVYTCPGSADKGSGVIAPVAYGQCDGGFCFRSTRRQRYPGFSDRLREDEIICSCPISTNATSGSSDSFGYQVFGPYHPGAAIGSRCDASACNACSIPNPTANGATISVGAPTGGGKFLALMLDGPPLPDINECLCSCQASGISGAISCTVGEDRTP
jgi:hypothetical protein